MQSSKMRTYTSLLPIRISLQREKLVASPAKYMLNEDYVVARHF